MAVSATDTIQQKTVCDAQMEVGEPGILGTGLAHQLVVVLCLPVVAVCADP